MKRNLIVALILTLSALFAERANAQTISAHGSGTVSGSSDCTIPTCDPPIFSGGGKGVAFSFSFSGTGTDFAVGNGTFTAVDKETNISVAYAGVANINADAHALSSPGLVVCLLTAPNGTTEVGLCEFTAVDRTSNGQADLASLIGFSATLELDGGGSLASGNVNID